MRRIEVGMTAATGGGGMQTGDGGHERKTRVLGLMGR
jgi:hypothetical protein